MTVSGAASTYVIRVGGQKRIQVQMLGSGPGPGYVGHMGHVYRGGRYVVFCTRSGRIRGHEPARVRHR